jgi:hypothetical protein
MSDWNLGRVFRVAVAYVVGVYTGYWSLLASQLMREHGSVQRNKQRRRALEQYNASPRDRLEMVDLLPDAPRTLVLGRVRAVEGVRRRWTSGTNDQQLTLIVSFAGHEIDAYEQWYVNDLPVTLDAEGWVQQAPYYRLDGESRYTSGTLNGAGGATVSLTGTPAAGTPVYATYFTDGGKTQGTLAVSVVGSTATVPPGSGPAGAGYRIHYQVGVVRRFLRIRPYTGAPGQNVGAAIAAEYPGKITSTDRFEGVAVAVVDLIFDTDVYPQGRPNITAVMRGARCLDPRTATTAWTENPALLALRYATWPTGWALQVADVHTADVISAANASDASTTFTLRKSDGTTTTATLPRHRAGIVISDDADHAQSMAEIVEAMGGQTAVAGGVLRMRAAEMRASVATITQDWLVRDVEGGEASGDAVISAVQTVPSTRRYNYVSGTCVDPAQRYQALPFPAVQDAVLVAAKGRRPLEVTYQAVTHTAHAQHLASILIREAQAGLRFELLCDDRAADLELLDVVTLDMPDYGYSGKAFEVVGWQWAQRGTYKVQLAEITAALFTPLAELTGRDPAPDSSLRQPWEVEAIGAPTVTSGLASTQDGAIVSRAVVTWPAAVGEYIRQGGRIEVQYVDTYADPASDWPSLLEAGTATSATLTGLLAGRLYLFRVRAVQQQPLVRGPWSPVVRHQVAGVPLVGTAGLEPEAATRVGSAFAAGPITRSNIA